jgi:AraC-like DNA-binding protein
MPEPSLYVVDTPSRELTATGFWVTHVGSSSGDYRYQNYGRTSADHVLMLTVAGEGWYRVSDRTGVLTSGDLCLLPAGVEHGLGCGPGGRWDLLWAHIGGPAVGPLLAWWPGFASGRYVIVASLEETSRLLHAAVVELQARLDGYGLAAAGHVQQAIRAAIIAARRDLAGPQQRDSPALRARAYIDERLEETLTLDRIAAHVNLSPAYLCRLFKQATGYSPMEYTIKQRINRAKDLLQRTDIPIGTIAYQAGYTDAGYFGRTFRQQTGMSPSAYRRMSLAGQQER